MKRSRARFKYALRMCKKHEIELRADLILWQNICYKRIMSLSGKMLITIIVKHFLFLTL